MTIRSYLTRLVALAILPVSVFAIFLAAERVVDLAHARDQEAINAAQTAVASLDSQLASMIDALNVLADSPALDQAETLAAFYPSAKTFLRYHGSNILVVDPGGQQVLSTRRRWGDPLPKVAEMQAVPSVFITKRPAVSNIFYGNLVNQPMIDVAVPVVRQGVVQYALVLSLELSKVQEQLSANTLRGGWELHLVDGNGLFVASQPEDPELVARRAPTSLTNAVWSARSGLFDAKTPAGVPAREVVVHSTMAPWAISLSIPRQQYIGTVVRSGLQVVMMGLVAIAVTVLGSLVVGRRLARAIAMLGHAGHPLAAPQSGILEVDEAGRALRQAEIDRAAASVLEQKVASVLASTTDGMLEVDREWRITFMNERARRLIAGGHNVVGQKLWDLYPEEVGHVFEENCRMALESGQQVEFEGYAARLNTWFAVRAVPSDNGLAAYFQDITARKRADQELYRQRELLAKILEMLPVGVWILDKDGRLTMSNPAAQRIWAGARWVGLEHLGQYRGWWRRTGAPIRAEEWAAARAIKGETSLQEEVDIEAFDGMRKTILNSALPLRGLDGAVEGALVVNEDITTLTEMEEELRAAWRKAEEANAAKSKFLAAASHDLRQPVQSLMLLTSALTGQLHDHPATKVVEHMDRAMTALKDMLDGLLDISRLDAGIVEIDLQPVDLHDLLSRLAAEYSLRAAEKGLTFRLFAPPLWCRSDPRLLERLLRNLIENALKYTRRGGVLLGCRRRGRANVIAVVDTGIGIPEAELESVFREFHQLDNPERDRSKGLGLGLAIVRRLAALLGHEVHVQSRPGRGSTFAVLVAPAVPADAGETRDPPVRHVLGL